MLDYLLLLLILFPALVQLLAQTLPRYFSRDINYIVAPAILVLTALDYFLDANFNFALLRLGGAIELNFTLDPLSGLIGAAVMAIGASVIRFSVRYLQDDPSRARFHRQLGFTLSSVLAMIFSSGLLVFWVSWLVTSYFLHQLLTHFSDRPAAIVAANQKFWISRLGDLLVISAAIMISTMFGTFEFSEIAEKANELAIQGQHHLLYNLAALFLVLGAMTKSAQWPFHYWLPQTMDTPTPVSAIMHAGIINAGGFLIVRMSPFLVQAPVALTILALVGGFTAFYGSFVMISQTNVKRSLAFSTISQMGFMMLQCGLGAFSIAVVHIIGHGFYKAYAFLGSGTATDYARLNRYLPKHKVQLSPLVLFGIAAIALCLVVAVTAGTGYRFTKPGAPVLILVLALAVAQTMISFRSWFDRIRMSVVLVCLYLSLSFLIDQALVGIVPESTSAFSGADFLVFGVLSLLFMALYLFQNGLDRIEKTEFGKKLYVKSLNGGRFGG